MLKGMLKRMLERRINQPAGVDPGVDPGSGAGVDPGSEEGCVLKAAKAANARHLLPVLLVVLQRLDTKSQNAHFGSTMGLSADTGPSRGLREAAPMQLLRIWGP